MSTVAVDIGGTFTDLAALDPATGALRFAKTLTTPPNFDQGAMQCLVHAGIDIPGMAILRHGTTVVINALLERQGARTALVTTEGFRDLLEIGRGNRPEAFNLFYHRLPPLVPRDLRLEVSERIDARGAVLRKLDEAALAGIADLLIRRGIEAVAVCLLHAWRNPVHEAAIGAYLRRHTPCFVSCSHEISREFREFERTSTAVLNAYTGPAVAHYLNRFGTSLRAEGFVGQLYLMGSNGGVLSEAETRSKPLLLVESGPVGGAAGAAALGSAIGLDRLVAFDMGGTTAKAVLIENGEAAVSPLYWVGGYERGYPVQAAVLDIVEVGTGGGSIAGMNQLGALQVGPHSAGAAPGPACYGNGGTEPTVTDANLLLGRLDAGHFLGGAMSLDEARAATALAGLADKLDQDVTRLAGGILQIATLTMASAVRRVTIERGYDPRDFAMVAFGGAGPLHAVEVAREIGMRRVIVPPHPGHFSAYGMLFADFRHDLVDTVATTLHAADLDELERRFATLESEGERALLHLGLRVEQLRCIRYAEMRYARQEYTIKVRLPDRMPDRDTLRSIFESAYERRYGHVSAAMAIDIVMLRVVADGSTPRGPHQPPPAMVTRDAAPRQRPVWFAESGRIATAIWQRAALSSGQRITGPAVIEEEASTTIVPPDDVAEIDAGGNIVITLRSAS